MKLMNSVRGHIGKQPLLFTILFVLVITIVLLVTLATNSTNTSAAAESTPSILPGMEFLICPVGLVRPLLSCLWMENGNFTGSNCWNPLIFTLLPHLSLHRPSNKCRKLGQRIAWQMIKSSPTGVMRPIDSAFYFLMRR